jgi:hypothetical protein
MHFLENNAYSQYEWTAWQNARFIEKQISFVKLIGMAMKFVFAGRISKQTINAVRRQQSSISPQESRCITHCQIPILYYFFLKRKEEVFMLFATKWKRRYLRQLIFWFYITFTSTLISTQAWKSSKISFWTTNMKMF